MTRRPDADEHIVLPERSGWAKGERIYLTELSAFLHQSTTSVRRWAKKQGLTKRIRLRIAGSGNHVEYFTRYGALRVIAHFRGLQGEEYLKGKDYHRKKDLAVSYPKRRLARLSK